MLSSLLAAAESGHEEPSKTAFYIAGMALAVWGFSIGIIGVRNSAFAATNAAAKPIAAVTTLLVIATMATSVLTG